jgi:nucleoside-diphosphate-sugar epimerase
MMQVLVLGGTAWLGSVVAADAVARGHRVTARARGTSGPAPAGVRLVPADRDRPDGYAALPRQDWDAVIDVTRHPGHARGAAAALGERTAYLAFVSTGSVYAEHGQPGADESAALLEPLVGDRLTDMQGYGRAKVACESAYLDALGSRRVLVARSGLIGGPGDWSSRTGYWAWRFAHPATDDGAVVVPEVPGLDTQVVDVRDLAAWLVDCCERRTTGVVNAMGERVRLAEHLALAREVAGHSGPVLAADSEWLVAQGIQPWMGERSLPLWLPMPQYAGFNARSTAAGRAAGLHPRPLAQTLTDALAWEHTRDPAALRPAGLDDEAAAALVAAWRTSRGLAR